uniref:Secreted protein n=1 Tax=Angiostrongylus cantonensis TaxID=6313 RepID=A0A0K0DI50_ANGCA
MIRYVAMDVTLQVTFCITVSRLGRVSPSCWTAVDLRTMPPRIDAAAAAAAETTLLAGRLAGWLAARLRDGVIDEAVGAGRENSMWILEASKI